jgi:Holliday junction resolvase
MTDTPNHLQLKIWMEKSLGERLYIALKTNEELYLMHKDMRENMKNDTKIDDQTK